MVYELHESLRLKVTCLVDDKGVSRLAAEFVDIRSGLRASKLDDPASLRNPSLQVRIMKLHPDPQIRIQLLQACGHGVPHELTSPVATLGDVIGNGILVFAGLLRQEQGQSVGLGGSPAGANGNQPSVVREKLSLFGGRAFVNPIEDLVYLKRPAGFDISVQRPKDLFGSLS
jgi:hypothetical protein